MDRILLLSTVKKILDLPYEDTEYDNVMHYRQECLDFLAMVAGIKPVFLTGRGFDDEDWAQGAADIARKMGMHVLVGAMWNAMLEREGMPDWFVEFAGAGRAGQAVFICREKEDAAAVQKAIDAGKTSVEEEARLLGYPPCCVRAEYERDLALDRAYHSMLSRVAVGDEEKMKRLIDDDVEMGAETEDEDRLLAQAEMIGRAPFTSVNFCAACKIDPNSPARRLSKQYEDLARFTDRWFADVFMAGKPYGYGHPYNDTGAHD